MALHRSQQIIFVCRGHLEALPPVLYAALTCSQLRTAVTIITSRAAHNVRDLLGASGISLVELEPHFEPPRSRPQKLASWIRFRTRARRALARLPNNATLWIASADTALALGPPPSRRFILQLHELHDRNALYKLGLNRWLPAAYRVIVPEDTRADLYQMWYRLPVRPIVIPNRPGIANGYSPPAQSPYTFTDADRIVLYQGHLWPERDVSPIAQAIHHLGPPWRFAVMGRTTPYLELLQSKWPDVLHVPYITPPNHLAVTQQAHIGVIVYAPDSLNHLFCAPNKVWEYAAFGVPMICNTLPALRGLVHRHNAGLCVDFADLPALQKALMTLSDRRAFYSRAALSMYAAHDTTNTFTSLLQTLSANNNAS
jgi:glycosyltransferase involved in cell wall biosynthesis